ncbi:MAG: toprim domain-containing protein [Rhodoferax sp.]
MSGTIQNAMAAAGLQPHKDLDLPTDGKIHRYRVTGDKSGSVNGWAVLHAGSSPFGAFGSWKTGESHTWQATRSTPITPAELAAQRKHRAQLNQALEIERETVQAAARDKAQRLWGRAKPATNAHPYLQRKQINAYGIKQLRDMLLIPARDVSGALQTLQFISADGSKRFLTGGRVNGCYCAIGKPIDSLLIAEGYATAATLFEATGQAVAACFSCGNMEAVARALRCKFPRLKLILCADNDAHTPGNPGLTKAREAARAIGGFLAVPKFREVSA